MVDQDMSQSRSNPRVDVIRDVTGWELRQEGSTGEVRITHYSDWHRVERALRSIEIARVSRRQVD